MAARRPAIKAKKPAPKPLVTDNGARVRKLKRREQKNAYSPLPSVWRLLKSSLAHIYKNKKLFLGILAIYGILYVVLVKGFSKSFELSTSQDTFNEILGESSSALDTGVSLYGVLLGSAGSSSSDLAGLYQTILFVIISLVLIWALRQTYQDKTTVSLRNAFYESTGQLVPFMIVLFFIALHCLPVIVGLSVYSTVTVNNLALSGIEQVLSLGIFIAGLAWSLYLLSSSLLAMYIVTLPGKYPRASLQAAKELVKFRRVQIARKIIFLPVLFITLSALVLIPLLILFTPAAEFVFLLFTVAILGITHSYLYSLYRSTL